MKPHLLLITVLLAPMLACDGTSEPPPTKTPIGQENEQQPAGDGAIAPRRTQSLHDELALLADNVDDFLHAEIHELVEDELVIDRDLAGRKLLQSDEHVIRYKRNFVDHLQAFENDVALLEVLLATAAPAQSDLGWRVFLDGKRAWDDHNSTFSREHLGDFAAAGTIREVEAEIAAEIEAAFDRVRAIQFSSIPL